MAHNRCKVGDVVTRKSYGCDIFFKVEEVKENGGSPVAVLRGLEVRLIADAPVEDLEVKDATEIFQFRHECIQANMRCFRAIHQERAEMRGKKLFRGESKDGVEFFEVPGSVLHLDGDPEYLGKCLQAYKQVEVDADGIYLPESEQPQRIGQLLQDYQPDVLVLTGHDALIKGSTDLSSLDSYRNSRYFVQAVKEARRVAPGLDDLVIFAGACQSHYEALLAAGANFASSPKRIFIHAYDPVFVVQKVAFTSIYESVGLEQVIGSTITGSDGVGGVETRGCFRWGYPRSPY